jgi:hypothetical protein
MNIQVSIIKLSFNNGLMSHRSAQYIDCDWDVKTFYVTKL